MPIAARSFEAKRFGSIGARGVSSGAAWGVRESVAARAAGRTFGRAFGLASLLAALQMIGSPHPVPSADDSTIGSTERAVASRPIETAAATNAWEGYVTPVRRIQVPAPDSGLLRLADTAPGREVESGERLAQLDRSRQERERELAATELQLAELKLADEAQRRLDYASALRSELETATPARTADAPDQVESRRIARLLLVPPREPLERERLETRRREAEYEVALRKLALDGARAEVARGEIVAPFAGVVTQRYRQAGEWVEAGSPVCELVAMDRLQAEVAVPIADPALVDLVGRACRLTIDTAGGGTVEVAATIARVGELVGANGRVAVVAEFDNPKADGRRAVLPGSRVRLELDPATDVRPE